MSARDDAGVFLDRDGTLIVDRGYPREPERVELLAGVADGLRQLQQEGFRLVVVSNQSGIGRGIVSEAEARRVHERFVAVLEHEGVLLDAVLYCHHAPWEGCACRKPEPTLLISAAAALSLDLERSFMVGDKPSDVEAGRRAGCRTVLFAPGMISCEGADHVASDWGDVVAFIIGWRAVV